MKSVFGQKITALSFYNNCLHLSRMVSASITAKLPYGRAANALGDKAFDHQKGERLSEVGAETIRLRDEQKK